jgi:hypothetical protein
MLDQQSDESIRHPPQEELQAYANGRLESSRLSYCQAHLDSCDACRAELEDLRTLQSDLSAFSQAASAQRGLGRSRPRRKLALPLTTLVAAIFVAAVCTFVFWRRESPRASKPATPAPIQQAATSPPAAPVQTSDTQHADKVAAVLEDADRFRSRSPPEINREFALLGPLGDTIAETRPQFSWQPLPGATRYSVAIVDAGLHPVQRSPALRTTVWRPRRPLRRGRTYLWQVTATLRGGSKVVASGPSPSGALLRINPSGSMSQ